jgi:hypothetical protein
VSSDRVYLNKEEQIFLTEMLEIEDLNRAVEVYALMMVDSRADPKDLQLYLKKTIKAYFEEYVKRKK